jgi:DNA-directed RNA polymerase subunit beta'
MLTDHETEALNLVDNSSGADNSAGSVFPHIPMLLKKESTARPFGIILDGKSLMSSDLADRLTSDEFESANNLQLSFRISSKSESEKQSHGKVVSAETLLYRRGDPVPGGLQDARIFGPVKDYECLCGKYKRLKHRGVICEKCGVEVTTSRVRRERMGHIELVSPVVHIWFLKALPSYLGLMLDMPLRDIERVLYFEDYVVIDPGMAPLQRGQLLKERDYQEALATHGEGEFDVRMGAEAIEQLLLTIDLEREIETLREAIPNTGSETRLKKYIKRLRFLEEFKASGNKPNYMILRVLPVLPPDLRPLVPLDGGRLASSELNHLYRGVLNRNNRLEKLLKASGSGRLLEAHTPDIIIRNEQRMLQESVDALLDNGRRGRPITANNKRPLKSLTDELKGKSGRFRQNLLGKRVDYSGRSVIVVGPSLRLDQFGLPKEMALELFKPFIFNKLLFRGIASTIKIAKKLVEAKVPEVWNILAEVIKEHPLLLNRAPTLHRLGLQAFNPILIEGKAIQLHPLVCTAFNADFDGDQMAVHVPLTLEAQMEARVLMMSTNNILSPANGEPVITPTQDIVLGLYYLTRDRLNAMGEGGIFANIDEVERFYETQKIALHARIKVRIEEVAIEDNEDGGESGAVGTTSPPSYAAVKGELPSYAEALHDTPPTYAQVDKGRARLTKKLVETTVGRALLSRILPRGLSFELINKTLKQGSIAALLKECYRRLGPKVTVIFVDQLKDIGFYYATKSGISLCITDLVIPEEKGGIIQHAESNIQEIQSQFVAGLLTQSERYNKVVDIWSRTKEKVATAMMEAISTETVVNAQGETQKEPSFNSMFIMADSGARGSLEQMQQLSGMRGLMTNTKGSIIEAAIPANFREGLTELQVFQSAPGGRKGMADTAVKTAVAGHLTRRLVDVVQDVVVTIRDCGTFTGITKTLSVEGGEMMVSLRDRMLGRTLCEDVELPGDQKVILRRNTLLGEREVKWIEDSGMDQIKIRSPIPCEAERGICATCYGLDLARSQLVSIGEAVGVIAAQSIGEPGTQLTMQTFHIGGTASRITLANNVQVKSNGVVKFHNLKFVQHPDGHLVTISRSGKISLQDARGRERERYKIPYGAIIWVSEDTEVEAAQIIAEWDPHIHPIITEVAGIIKFVDLVEGVTVNQQLDEVTGLSSIVVTDIRHRGVGGKELRPMVQLLDKEGNELCFSGTNAPAHYFLPINAVLSVENGAKINAGDTIARIPQESTKTQDITGGLPRVADLFEARKPKEPAILAEIEGVISFGKETKGKRRLIITNDAGNTFEVLVPKWRHLVVFEGEYVEKGEVISDGSLNPHDVLRLLGVDALANYIVREVQEVYKLQGVSINDKHIEVIVREMLRNVSIVDPGDGHYLQGEQLDEATARKENEKLLAQKKRPMIYQRELTRVSLQSLRTKSPLSGAAFQNTVQVLTRAVITGAKDDLTSLKASVILGGLMHAGTGMPYQSNDKTLSKPVTSSMLQGVVEST